MRRTVLWVSMVFAMVLSGSAVAADPASAASVQTGRMSTVHLLATGRGSPSAPDAMRFMFMVMRAPGTTGALTLKETRDFLIGGQSYQEKTQAELGRQIEPATAVDSADGFFSRQPGARGLAPDNISGAQIITIMIPGAPLAPGARGEVKLEVGFNKEVEPFTFSFNVPGTNAAGNRESVMPSQAVALANGMRR
jgi:hypothetical protein